MAEVVYPLRVFLEEHLAGHKRRTKLVASNRAMSAGDWTSGLIGAWEAAQDLAAHAVALSHPKPGWAVLMFLDASNKHWGVFSRRCPRKSSTAAFQSRTSLTSLLDF